MPLVDVSLTQSMKLVVMQSLLEIGIDDGEVE
jgi:hypothetical protein